MFGTDLNEEEKAQLVKDWLRRYLLYIVGGVAMLVAGISGYNYYTGDKTDTNQHATELLFELITLNSTAIEEQNQDAKARAAAIDKAAELTDALAALQADSYQTNMGRIQHAKLLLANKSNYDQVKSALANTPSSKDPLISAAATLLLANAAWANNDADNALKLLQEKVFHSSIHPVARQLMGDIYLAQGNKEKAAEAYLEVSEAGLSSELLSLKQMLANSSDQSDSR